MLINLIFVIEINKCDNKRVFLLYVFEHRSRRFTRWIEIWNNVDFLLWNRIEVCVWLNDDIWKNDKMIFANSTSKMWRSYNECYSTFNIYIQHIKCHNLWYRFIITLTLIFAHAIFVTIKAICFFMYLILYLEVLV